MRTLFTATVSVALLVASCQGTDDSRDEDVDSDAGPGDTGSGNDDGVWGSLSGTVLSPSGDLPIPGALVYMTMSDPPEIPDGVFCYECEDMTGKIWTLSGADGTWSLENVPAGDWTIVTRKGNFQRQRALEVSGTLNQQVPAALTTLPGDDSEDGLDRIPDYAVLLTWPDRPQDLLAKLGMGELNGQGQLIWGTETFDCYTDDGVNPEYQPSLSVMGDATMMGMYHMIFLPCFATELGFGYIDGQSDELRSYVAAGGKLYSTCCANYWVEYPFPEYIDFHDDDEGDWDMGIGRVGQYNTQGQIVDEGMADWLQVVAATNPDSVPFTNGFIQIDELVEVNDGMGLAEDDGWVIPKAWVLDQAAFPGSPLTVTYNWGCGEVFYSVYETSSDSGTEITPQEYVLLFMILEVGVCEGDYLPPE